jgi:hypothetical protein
MAPYKSTGGKKRYHLSKSPLTPFQKLFTRSNFTRVDRATKKCLHCEKIIKNNHLKRLATHLIGCKLVPQSDIEIFLSGEALDSETKCEISDSLDDVLVALGFNFEEETVIFDG